jgi:hypothetical protein
MRRRTSIKEVVVVIEETIIEDGEDEEGEEVGIREEGIEGSKGEVVVDNPMGAVEEAGAMVEIKETSLDLDLN